MNIKNLLGVCVLSTAVVISTFGFTINKTAEHYRTLQREYLRERDNTQQVLLDHQWVNANESEYGVLLETGLIGPADTLIWLDFLSSLEGRIFMADYQYEIGKPSLQPLNGGVTLARVEIVLSANLLHDIELERLLTQLENHAPGISFVQSVEVIRQSARTAPSSANLLTSELHHSLDVLISIAWMTLVPDNSTETEI